jgi:hypothetical protein
LFYSGFLKTKLMFLFIKKKEVKMIKIKKASSLMLILLVTFSLPALLWASAPSYHCGPLLCWGCTIWGDDCYWLDMTGFCCGACDYINWRGEHVHVECCYPVDCYGI